MTTVFCRHCGQTIHHAALVCPPLRLRPDQHRAERHHHLGHRLPRHEPRGAARVGRPVPADPQGRRPEPVEAVAAHAPGKPRCFFQRLGAAAGPYLLCPVGHVAAGGGGVGGVCAGGGHDESAHGGADAGGWLLCDQPGGVHLAGQSGLLPQGGVGRQRVVVNGFGGHRSRIAGARQAGLNGRQPPSESRARRTPFRPRDSASAAHRPNCETCHPAMRKKADGAKRHQRGRDEHDTEFGQLQRDRALSGIDELRQECEEKEDHLGVGQVHDDAAHEQLAGLQVRLPFVAGLGHGRAEGLPCEVGQVGRTDELQRDERELGCGEHGSKAECHGGGVDEQAGAQAQHHIEPGLAPVAGRLQQHKNVVGAGREAEEQGDAEEGDDGLEGEHGRRRGW